MTLSPEMRAAVVIESYWKGAKTLEALIATAIREAEERWRDRANDLEMVVDAYKDAVKAIRNQALDEAIDCVRDNFANDEGHYAIEAIRSLKSKD